MKTILILYYSKHGSVSTLARHIANGVESVSQCEAILRTVPPVSTVCEATEEAIPASGDVYVTLPEIEACDGLIIGSPTRFGTIAAPLKYLFEQTTPLWLSGALDGKPAAVFTSSGSVHGGQESTLLSMMLPLIHHGMVIVGIPFFNTSLGQSTTGGTPYGASHVAGGDSGNPFSEDEKNLAEVLGKRVATCALALTPTRTQTQANNPS